MVYGVEDGEYGLVVFVGELDADAFVGYAFRDAPCGMGGC